MRLKTMMVAALAALTLAACSKDNEGGEISKGAESGEEASVSLSFTVPVPASGITRTIDATANESNIENVMVYLFRSTTGAGIKGNNSGFASSSLTPNGNGHDIPDITSIAVTADIYVVINHPAYGTPAASYATREDLLDDIAKVDKMSDKSNNGKEFTMVASDNNVRLKEYVSTDPTTATEVKLSAKRVVARVVSSSVDPTYNAVWRVDPTDPLSAVFNTLTYTIKEFNVYQEALKSYVVANTATYSPYAYPADADAFSPYAVSWKKPNKAVGTGNLVHGTDDLAITALATYYIGENTPGNDLTLNKNTTYVMIATKVRATHYAYWDTAAQEVKWETPANLGHSYTADDDMFVINYKGISYISQDEAQIIEISQEIGGATPLGIYTYPESYVHFQVFLNGKNLAGQSAKNTYSVDRNQLIHVKITGLNDAGNSFPGYPGGDGDGSTDPGPDKPIDPNEGGNPNNPDPKEPEEKVDPEDSLLKITIEIDPWDYAENKVELS